MMPLNAPSGLSERKKVDFQGLEFKLKIDIGRVDGHDAKKISAAWAQDSRLLLTPMKFRVSDMVVGAEMVPMPGSEGPNPSLSSGAKPLEIDCMPHFHDATGKCVVDLQKGSWETVFRQGAPAGQLIFGFFCAEGAKRNDAYIPPGNIYVQFPIWDKQKLADFKSQVEGALAKRQGYEEERNKALDEMHKTSNLVLKALKYREACVAMEKIHISSAPSMASKIPKKVIELVEEDLVLANLGTVWCKTKDMFGGNHALLGHCTIDINRE